MPGQARAMGVGATRDRSKVTCILNETSEQGTSIDMGTYCSLQRLRLTNKLEVFTYPACYYYES